MKEHKEGASYRYGSIKRDGHCTLLMMQNGEVKVESRGGVDITKKLLWTPWLQTAQRKARRDTAKRTFYGELWIPGRDATYVKTAYCHQDPALRFDVFGCTHLAEGCPLEEVQEDALGMGQSVIEFWDFCEGAALIHAYSYQDDVEGFVYSDGNMCNQHKVKPMKTCDLVIQGWKPGEGKYAGSIGALLVGTADGEELASVSSGLTDALRLRMSINPDAWIGTVVEVQYQGVGSQGRLRHPVFKMVREDKRASECTVEQLR